MFSNDTAVLERENATFVCSATSEPTHTVEWLVGNTLLDVNSEKYTIKNRPGDLDREFVSTLSVSNTTLDDVGDYTCNVSNIHGSQSATAHLEVQGNSSKHTNSLNSSKHF